MGIQRLVELRLVGWLRWGGWLVSRWLVVELAEVHVAWSVHVGAWRVIPLPFRLDKGGPDFPWLLVGGWSLDVGC